MDKVKNFIFKGLHFKEKKDLTMYIGSNNARKSVRVLWTFPVEYWDMLNLDSFFIHTRLPKGQIKKCKHTANNFKSKI